MRGMRLSFGSYLNRRNSPLCNEPFFINERTPSDNETSAEVKQWDYFGTHHSLFTLDFSLFLSAVLLLSYGREIKSAKSSSPQLLLTLYQDAL